MTEKLHPATANLVNEFCEALKEKLLRSQVKYGFTTGWMGDKWEGECRTALMEHIKKGDPLDVAAYCAFMWHHGWPTITKPEEKAGD